MLRDVQSFKTLTELIVFFCNFEHFFLKEKPVLAILSKN